MFRHQGENRTLRHNLQIATVLSFVAGVVNITGFLSIRQLTTNVTGHFALLINDLGNLQFWYGMIFFMYILAFLTGSFLSGLLIEKYKMNKRLNVYVLPTLLESFILTVVIIIGNISGTEHPNLIACLLLFAMGMQNSYVTKISNAVVRTTHLTGLFTDLGIELSQLCFQLSPEKRSQLRTTVKLRIYIILFFFLGGLIGGILYLKAGLKLNTLALCVLILITSLVYDDLRFRSSNKKQNLTR